MVKRIKLSDTDTGSSEVPTNGDVSSTDAVALLEKMDWKLWEIYNIIKNYVESAPVGYVANAQQPQSSASDVAQELVKALNQGGGSEEKKSVVKKLFG